MVSIASLILRVSEFIWTVLIMGLVGNMIDMAVRGNPSIINFDMFLAVFSLLSLFYLFAVAFNDGFAGHPAIPLALDVLNCIFFFCAGCAMAADLHVHSCGNRDYINSNGVTNGTLPEHRGKRCREAQAVTAFIWFGFASYLGSVVVSALAARGGINMRGRGGIRKGGPAMSQV